MSFKSITTFLHDPSAALTTLDYAIDAARRWGAHLHIVAAGIDSTDPGFYYAGAQAIAIQQNHEFAQTQAGEIETIIRTRLHAEEINWDVETVSLMSGGLLSFISDHMRFFDVAILPLPYNEGRSRLDVAAFEACLFGADIPVIVVPNCNTQKPPSTRVLIAWDDGAEALAATRAMLPIIDSVGLTNICVVNPSDVGIDRSDPGGRLAQLLSRAGATVEITVSAKMRSNVAEQLIQHATETGAEMIVMGAYGHSRLREAFIGGVTRTILRQSPVPVLLAN
jgi:nucleotide-binding universal stress UspA family protein